MSMQDFYKQLSEVSKEQDHYQEALVAIKESDQTQLSELVSDLAWQTWGEG